MCERAAHNQTTAAVSRYVSHWCRHSRRRPRWSRPWWHSAHDSGIGTCRAVPERRSIRRRTAPWQHLSRVSRLPATGSGRCRRSHDSTDARMTLTIIESSPWLSRCRGRWAPTRLECVHGPSARWRRRTVDEPLPDTGSLQAQLSSTRHHPSICATFPWRARRLIDLRQFCGTASRYCSTTNRRWRIPVHHYFASYERFIWPFTLWAKYCFCNLCIYYDCGWM